MIRNSPINNTSRRVCKSVYAIQLKDGRVKIGVSHDPFSRAEGLRGVVLWCVPAMYPFAIEEEIVEMFNPRTDTNAPLSSETFPMSHHEAFLSEQMARRMAREQVLKTPLFAITWPEIYGDPVDVPLQRPRGTGAYRQRYSNYFNRTTKR